MALVLALAVMMVLTLMVTSVISFTSSNSGAASRSNADQKAYALAEAGLNNALAVLHANYPGTAAYPGNANLLPARTTSYSGGGSATWSGTLVGPLTGAWRYEWRVTSKGTARNPVGGSSTQLSRTVTATVPVDLPDTTPTDLASVLNWIFSGTDTYFTNSVQIGSPVYATRDLYLSNTAKIRGTAHKLIVGRNLYLSRPQNRVGLVSGLTPADARIDQAHVVGQCSSQAIPLLHNCLWDADLVFATDAQQRDPSCSGRDAEADVLRAVPGFDSSCWDGQPEQHGLLVPVRGPRPVVAVRPGHEARYAADLRESRKQRDRQQRHAVDGIQSHARRCVIHV